MFRRKPNWMVIGVSFAAGVVATIAGLIVAYAEVDRRYRGEFGPHDG